MTRRSVLVVYLWLFLGGWSLASCGEEDEPDAPRQRIGEACARSDECEEGLLCLAGELRCVRVCALGSEECGLGIACQPAGDQGYCPLPPAP